MALSAGALEGLIKAELQGQGFKLEGEHAFAGKLATAIANAVVAHVTSSAQVPVASGSSAGMYSVV
ncbi:hypothetical protein [Pseudoalteromonas xiamenensis]|uniref:Uncharacterized protein n=1 Tax=Pseudoalteromonas xiamenensis TaxID=882626 RepID=A0A975HKF0_9GAMM|nr:hypothetical protein [Pseudoalteromonas xiamenensis]QTH70961.1 hypothetical protein J5O05_13920 [Pseudoalteromonas xiamenensis]WMN59295.1 hypothetical protein NI389_13905 [Pseudoalteromonas xiamenensis]